MLGGELAVLQAPMFDGLSLDPFALFEDDLGSAKDSRAGLRYGSDLTDAEWRLIEPYLPSPLPRGRRRRWPMRRVVEAIF